MSAWLMVCMNTGTYQVYDKQKATVTGKCDCCRIQSNFTGTCRYILFTKVFAWEDNAHLTVVLILIVYYQSVTQLNRSLINITEKHLQHQRNLFHNFIGFKKASDRVWHAGLWQVPRSFNIEAGLIQAIQALYKNAVQSSWTVSIEVLQNNSMCPSGMLNLTRAPNFLSFKGVPSSLSRFFRGYFHPLIINLEGITACWKVLNFHQTWV